MNKHDTRYDICPVCKNPKRTVAKTCKKCRYFDMRSSTVQPLRPELITKEWIAEFRGLFSGEGSAMIVPNGRGKKDARSFTAILALVLREDDKPALESILVRLGGSIIRRNHSKNPNANPSLCWRITGLEHVLSVCKLILTDIGIPSKKMDDARQVMEFCEWRLPRKGRLLSEEDILEAKRRHDNLIRSRAYSIDKVQGQVISA